MLWKRVVIFLGGMHIKENMISSSLQIAIFSIVVPFLLPRKHCLESYTTALILYTFSLLQDAAFLSNAEQLL